MNYGFSIQIKLEPVLENNSDIVDNNFSAKFKILNIIDFRLFYENHKTEKLFFLINTK